MNTLQKVVTASVLASASTLAFTAESRSLTTSCEIALALSAAPAHLQQKAGVFVLGEYGYTKVKDTDNGFNCIVERNHADSVIPICFGAASTDANLAAIIDGGEQVRAGASYAEMLERRVQAVSSGAYARPGPGISYMISEFTYIYNPAAKAILKVEPHIMFHAPGLSAEDLGASTAAMLENRGLPMINEPGPHGFMVSFVDSHSPSGEVQKECQGQLPDESGMLRFPGY